MSRLATARQRVEIAVARLERAAQASHARAAERTELARALEQARAEGSALREVSDTLASRLDGVIGRLKLALEA